MLCLDEFGPLNLQPRLGHGWHPLTKPARFRATYKRTAGVRQLVAAYDPATGALYGHLHDRKTWRQIRELLRSLRARFSEHLIVILDNFSPHKKTELQAWVAEHDIELVFTPTYSSWLNLILSASSRRSARSSSTAPTIRAMPTRTPRSGRTCAGITGSLAPPSRGASTLRSIIRYPTLRHEALESLRAP